MSGLSKALSEVAGSIKQMLNNPQLKEAILTEAKQFLAETPQIGYKAAETPLGRLADQIGESVTRDLVFKIVKELSPENSIDASPGQTARSAVKADSNPKSLYVLGKLALKAMSQVGEATNKTSTITPLQTFPQKTDGSFPKPITAIYHSPVARIGGLDSKLSFSVALDSLEKELFSPEEIKRLSQGVTGKLPTQEEINAAVDAVVKKGPRKP